ncbi:DUF4263 domain-containing protein [Erwiniaceae bacterium BAC15a-03b]|uniref:DUF4263 domain-containing protein n=1 Tax=Winslowiella arboricola TaxID=2978220 RepID=A0A9J6PIV8_9GAMM|nr:Shedu immune nuclease family protein [Winslowiella arboricola]MCU5773975.1 DUF4263 domain-containing protein [Winslowiella arboricola]MCU5777298.1 DUF4263 domain-containing protein [Winslowiella arboricola]
MNSLVALADTNPPESVIQHFFEQNPHAICGSDFVHANSLISKFCLGSDYETDFAYVNPQSGPTFLYLVEIERPDKPIFNKNDSFTQEFNHAFQQIEDWFVWCSNNCTNLRNTLTPLKRGYNLPPFFVIRGILIYGRASEINNTRRKERWTQKVSSSHYINIRTYDGWAREMDRFLPGDGEDSPFGYVETVRYSQREFKKLTKPS